MDLSKYEYYRTDLGVLYCGDCLEILPHLEPVDLVLTDPPYSSGGQFRSDRNKTTRDKYVNTNSVETCFDDFMGDNRDQRAFLAWATMWMSKAFSISSHGACILCFTDWRQLPTMTDAIQCGGWVWRNIVTWWKPGIRMQRGRFSSSSEYIVYGSKGVPNEGEKSPQNVLVYQPVNGVNKEHIAEKPTALLQDLIGISKVDSAILDPFLGSGTTAVACERLKRKWIGIEISLDYCRIAKERIERERKQLKLF